MDENIRLVQGDITEQETDAIVNAANSSLMGGSGVDGAIHRAGGPAILEECKRIVAEHGRLPTGKAVITTAGAMKAKYVIHTVGPIWRGGKSNEQQLLADAYRNSLEIAVEHNIMTISFPSISTGAYGFPIEKAALIAFQTVLEFLWKRPIEEVRFVLFSQEDLRRYQKTFEKLRRV